MYSGSSDQTARAWVTEFGDCTRVFKGHKHSVSCIKFYEGLRKYIWIPLDNCILSCYLFSYSSHKWTQLLYTSMYTNEHNWIFRGHLFKIFFNLEEIFPRTFIECCEAFASEFLENLEKICSRCIYSAVEYLKHTLVFKRANNRLLLK